MVIKDILKFAHTSHANFSLFCTALKSTIYHLIAPFTTQYGVDQFLMMLKSERAVISGSVALYALIFCNFSATDSSGVQWLPHDMDVYELHVGGGSGVLCYMVQGV